MKRIILLFTFLVFFISSLIYAGEKVKFNPTANTLEISEAYLLNNPSICIFNIVLNIVPDNSLPYGILLKFTPSSSENYSDHGGCDTSPDTPYYDGAAMSLIIPEFSINGKIYVINLKIYKVGDEYKGLYIKSIKEKSTIQYNKEKLIGYCGYNSEGGVSSCSEFYYIEGNADIDSVIQSVETQCKSLDSHLIQGEYCPLHNNFTYGCRVKVLDYYINAYYKLSTYQQDLIENQKKGCEQYGGEFLENN